MQRPIHPEAKVHPAIREEIANYHAAIVNTVKDAITSHDVVVLGMSMNPFPGRARRLLEARGVPYHYLAWGSYLSQWKPRLAIKLWSGWSTFPQIFVRGTLIGGYTDLQRLIDSGEFAQLLAAPRVVPSHVGSGG
jgi:monothiol glutaredoxin